MKISIFISIAILILSSCHKKDDKQFSNWQVNSENHSTNNVSLTIGKSIAILNSNDIQERFEIRFNAGYLPKIGYYKLSHLSNPSDSVSFSIYTKGLFYFPSFNNHSSLYASEVNGKASYLLEKCWFINYNDYSDSVQVSGTFNEP